MKSTLKTIMLSQHITSFDGVSNISHSGVVNDGHRLFGTQVELSLAQCQLYLGLSLIKLMDAPVALLFRIRLLYFTKSEKHARPKGLKGAALSSKEVQCKFWIQTVNYRPHMYFPTYN